MGPGDSGPGIQGPGPDLRTGMGATAAQQPTLSPPTSPATPPTLTARAVQLRWGLSTFRAGGWAAMLGLCVEPGGSLLPPPALPQPGPCAACLPCPSFVPKAGGGGRPTVPEAGQPALTLTLPAPPPFPRGSTSGFFSPFPWSLRGQILIPSLLLLWGMWVQPRVGGCFSPPSPWDPSLQPSGTAPCKKPNLWSLPEKPCPLCCLASPTCALPSSLYLSPWAAPWGAPHSQVPLWCDVRHFARKSHLGKDRKDKKINFHWPSGEPRVFARKLW